MRSYTSYILCLKSVKRINCIYLDVYRVSNISLSNFAVHLTAFQYSRASLHYVHCPFYTNLYNCVNNLYCA